MSEQPTLPTRDDDADAQAWFYLDHREDIETWAGLRSEAARLLERYLLALAPQLDELATELGAEAYAEDLEAGSWPRFGLRRGTWHHDGLSDITVIIEWDRSKLLSPSKPWPYVGVRLSPSQVDPARRQRIFEALADFRRSTGAQRSQTWPAWRFLPAPGDGRAVDPAALAGDAWSALQDLWKATAPVLDALHQPHLAEDKG